jgi:chromosome segregation ATPase
VENNETNKTQTAQVIQAAVKRNPIRETLISVGIGIILGAAITGGLWFGTWKSANGSGALGRANDALQLAEAEVSKLSKAAELLRSKIGSLEGKHEGDIQRIAELNSLVVEYTEELGRLGSLAENLTIGLSKSRNEVAELKKGNLINIIRIEELIGRVDILTSDLDFSGELISSIGATVDGIISGNSDVDSGLREALGRVKNITDQLGVILDADSGLEE